MGNSKVLASCYITAPFYRKLITVGGGVKLKDCYKK